jgi:hypothetical protein
MMTGDAHIHLPRNGMMGMRKMTAMLLAMVLSQQRDGFLMNPLRG